MHLRRKQALITVVTSIAGIIPWISRRAEADVAPPRLAPARAPAQAIPSAPEPTLDELKKRVAALEAALASQVAFTKDSSGNLTLRTTANLVIETGGNLNLKASAQGSFVSSSTMTIKGSTVNVN
jgi:hypothetical protein